MRCLEITFIPPGFQSGGNLGVYQSIYSLANIAEVDYIGPAFNKSIFPECRKRINIFANLEPSVITVKSLFRLFKGISTNYYDSWRKVENRIDMSKYDFVHVETSRYSFINKKFVNNKIPLMMRVHDINKDYSSNIYRKNKNIKNFVYYRVLQKSEKYAFRYVDLSIFLSKNDFYRAQELYKIKKNKCVINPVCVENRHLKPKRINSDHIKFLITGTLNYGSNIDGIIWFIKHVWKEVNTIIGKNFELVIAGSNPGENLRNLISLFDNIRLVDTPDNMEPYFLEADAYIAPIFDGSGMKVKIAEAYSYGLTVIGTDHAFIGYDNIHEGKYVANSACEFIECIKNFCKGEGLLLINKEIISEFESNYSLESSCNRYKKFVSMLNLEY